MKILILGSENCGLIANLKKGFSEIGYNRVTTAIKQYDLFFPGNRYDYVLQRPARKDSKLSTNLKHALNLLKWKCTRLVFDNYLFYNYDLYIFSWFTLKDDFSDLIELRKRNKKVVTLFIGSDVRWIDAFRQEFPNNTYKGHIDEDWVRKFRTLRMGELYSSAIFSVPDQSSLFMRGYYFMFMPLDIRNIRFKPSYRQKPLIIHAPSKRDIKGTSIILNAIDKLRTEGLSFDFEFLENIPNSVLVSKLEEVDILIDQLFLNGPATLACEAMAAGCAVATKYIAGAGMTADAPICYIDEHNLLENLRMMITDVDYRKTLVSQGRKFVERNNSMSVIASRILDSIERDKKKDYDYYPTFFTQKFVLPPQFEYPDEIKKLNEQVTAKYAVQKEFSPDGNAVFAH